MRFRRVKFGAALIGISAFILVSLPVVVVMQPEVSAQSPDDGRIPGATSRCQSDEFNAVNHAITGLLPPAGPLFWLAGVRPVDVEAGWAWVDPNNRFQEMTGRVFNSQLLYEDLPIVHDSHDQIFDVHLDPGQEYLLSDIITFLHLEWESSGFPEWAWPSVGDRVWAEGHWIFDCGHPADVNGVPHYKTEIHPPRAVASIRDRFGQLDGTGMTPVQIKQTDLYIHGMAGFAPTELYCGVEIILHPSGDCPDPVTHPHHGTPITEDFQFDIPLPPKPPNASDAVLSYYYEDGPGNTVTRDLIITPDMAAQSSVCEASPTCPVLHVTVPLARTNVTPADVYARRIYAGWVAAPSGLTHHRVRLDHGILFNDKDLDPSDCECELFWINIDKGVQPWIRLAGYDRPTDPDTSCPFVGDNELSSWDDNRGCGNGRLDFVGPTYFFYTGNGVPYHVGYVGIDQDCWDRLFYPNSHFLPGVGAAMGGCFLDPDDPGSPENDDLDKTTDEIPAFVGVPNGQLWEVDTRNYVMKTFHDTLPLRDEVSAEVGVTNKCHPTKVGVPDGTFTCTVDVRNAGPGLSRDTNVEFLLKRDAAMTQYSIGRPTFVENHFNVPGAPTIGGDCAVIHDIQPLTDSVQCRLGSLPSPPGNAEITVPVTVEQTGTFFTEARTTSVSTDSNPTNDTTQPLRVDALPGTNLGLSLSKDVVGYEEEATVTATVTPKQGTGVPTGTVRFLFFPPPNALPGAQIAHLCTPESLPIPGRCDDFPLVDGTTTAPFTFGGPPDQDEETGVWTIMAEYSGDSNFGASEASIPITLLPSEAKPTETTLTSFSTPIIEGADVTFIADVVALPDRSPVPVGGVQFIIDGEPVGTPVPVQGGQASRTVGDLSVGDHQVTAEYLGETATFQPSSASLTQTILPAPPQATFPLLSSSANPSSAGQTVTFSASVISGTSPVPGGSVQFEVDGAELGEPVLLTSEGTATTPPISLLGPGDHQIVVRYLGYTTGPYFYEPSSQSITHTVEPVSSTGPAPEVEIEASDNPAAGEPVYFTARIDPPAVPAAAEGGEARSAVRTIGGDRIGLARHTDARGGGREVNQADIQDPAEKQQVAARTQRSTEDPNANDFGHRMPLPPGDPGAPQNLETVQFKVDGVPIGYPVPVVVGQAVSAPVFDLGPGPHEVTADYLGASGRGSSSMPVTVGPVGEPPDDDEEPPDDDEEPPDDDEEPPDDDEEPPDDDEEPPDDDEEPSDDDEGEEAPDESEEAAPGRGGPAPDGGGGQPSVPRTPTPDPAATVPSGSAAAPIRGRPAVTGANIAQTIAVALLLGVTGALMVVTDGRRVRIRDQLGRG